MVLPRPGQMLLPGVPPIPGPSEKAFTATFGTLLPPAARLTTEDGTAAYYEIPPSQQAQDSVPKRVLVIHGVQTPALGMLPLTRALQSSFPDAHLVLVDLWGHGLSDTPILPHEPALFHRLIDRLMDHLAWSNAHLIGYSFGGALTAGYVASRPQRVRSFTLVAPAGLITSAGFSPEEKAHLRGESDEATARAWIISWLEGGELVVPADWQQRVARGEVVAEAVKEWQMREHPGHVASIAGIIRDGGVLDNEAAFDAASASGIPSLVVLGETDGFSTEKNVRHHGFSDVFIVPRVGHGVIRQSVPEVSAQISEFWRSLGLK